MLIILVIIYVTTGPAATRNSEFYKKTVALMEYRNRDAAGHDEQENHMPDRPIHRAGGLHYAEGDKHLTPQERLAMEQGKLRGEPMVGPDGEAIVGPVPQSNQQGQRPLIDTDAKLKERLKDAENAAKKSADEKYRALRDIEEEVQKERELRGADRQASIAANNGDKKMEKKPKPNKDKEREKENEATTLEEKHKDTKKPESGEMGIAGRKKIPVEDEVTAKDKKGSESKKETSDEDDKELTRLRSILAEILSKSPVTIFSKTYCPFSKKAKHILLEAYTISPAPYVVELNEHPDGPALQQLLVKTTGRKTVPNVLVNGKSIGGGDETQLLWKNGELPARIQQMAGKRVASVNANFAYGKEPGAQDAEGAEKPLKG